MPGANYPAVREEDIKGFSFRCPPLSEQQSIVAELDKINELISLKKTQLSDLDALAQSIFYDMFGDPIENEKGWEVKKLGEISTVKTGPFGSTDHGVGSTDHFLKFLYYTSFLTPHDPTSKFST